MGSFPAHDHPDPLRVAEQRAGGQYTGDLGQPGAVTMTTVGVDRVRPQPRRDRGDRGPFRGGDGPADGELAAHRATAAAADMCEELAGAAGGVGADQDRSAVPVSVG